MSADLAIAGVDLAALANWLDDQGVGQGRISAVELLGGGTQNILVAFTRGGRRYVLRRPALHARPRSDETILREARVLAALATTDVPHAQLVAVCPDPVPLGAAFFLTRHVAGSSLWDRDLGGVGGAGDPYAAALDVVAAFGALARVDVDAAGLADLGRTSDWPARQVSRWWERLRSYPPADGADGGRLPGADEAHAWLVASTPASVRPGLVHGDAHLGNVLISPHRPAVAAVVDWEMTTVGDPRLDLGQLLATWPVPGRVYADRVRATGLPTESEVVQVWSQTSGRDPGELRWYRVLAGFRLAVLLEGSQVRATEGLTDAATGSLLHARAVGLMAEAAAAAEV